MQEIQPCVENTAAPERCEAAQREGGAHSGRVIKLLDREAGVGGCQQRQLRAGVRQQLHDDRLALQHTHAASPRSRDLQTRPQQPVAAWRVGAERGAEGVTVPVVPETPPGSLISAVVSRQRAPMRMRTYASIQTIKVHRTAGLELPRSHG